jgi:hypothetical protein
MSGNIANARSRGFDAAVDFVSAQPGGARRLLDRHRRRPDGSCSRCVGTSTPWPCTSAVIAQLAGRRPTGSRPPMPRTQASDGESHATGTR